jgi:hypothetical protein
MQVSPHVILCVTYFNDLQEGASVRGLNRGGSGVNERFCISQVSASIIAPVFADLYFRLCPIFRISNVTGDGLDYVGYACSPMILGSFML